MSSIITNHASLTALALLRSTDNGLNKAQNQVSTGLKVAAASDNAAYWPISTTMKSDNSALSAVSDALGLGSAKVDTAYTGMTAVSDLLGQMKAKLVAATEDGVDKTKVQAELDQLKDQIQSVATSSSFDGQNWLSTDIGDMTDSTQNQASVVSSFVRASDGDVSVKSADIDLSKISLFNEGGGGLLQAASGTLSGNLGGLKNVSGSPPTLTFSPLTLDANDSISFDFNYNGTAHSITITKADIDAQTGRSDGTISSIFDMGWLLARTVQPSTSTNVNTQWGSPPQLSFFSLNGSDTMSITNVTSSDGSGAGGGGGSGANTDLIDMDITKSDDVSGYLTSIEAMQKSVISAASVLGSLKSRIDLQTDFTSKLADSLTSGIGKLVDADMEEASTKLQALQTQQQLNIQSLSIANSSSQSLLSLFRN